MARIECVPLHLDERRRVKPATTFQSLESTLAELSTRDGLTLDADALEVVYLLCDESVSLWDLTPAQRGIGRALGMLG